MNQTIIKTFFSFFGLLILLGFIFVSFFSNQNTQNASELVPNFQVEKSFFQKNSNGSIEKVTQDLATFDFGKEKLDILSSVYFTNADYKVTFNKDKGENSVEIGTGVYVFDFKNPLEEVVIMHKHFYTTLPSGGLTFIDTRDSSKYSVASFNSVTQLELKTNESTSTQTQIYLYPHNYIQFSYKRLSGRKNIDQLRLSQLTDLLYLPGSFNDIKNNNEFNFFLNEESKNILFGAFDIINNEYENTLQLVKKVKISGINTVPQSMYVEKYFNFFYNDIKKKVYYKNVILNNALLLFYGKGETLEIIKETQSTLSQLRDLDNKSYDEMVGIIHHYFYLSLMDLSDDSLDIKDHFQKLLSDSSNSGLKKLYQSFKHDFNILNITGKNHVYKNLSSSNSSSQNGGMKTLEYDYYVSFLRNIVDKGLNSNKLSLGEKNALIELFIFYTKSIDISLSTNTQDSFLEANIISHLNILKGIKEFLFENYFSNERGTQGLLELKKSYTGDIERFSSGVDGLFKYYNDGKLKGILNNTKYEALRESYEQLLQEFSEYFAALGDYSKYTNDYGEVNRKLLGTKTFQDKNTQTLSEEKLVNYLSEFNLVRINGTEFTIIDDSYYKIDMVVINGQAFSFNLYPEYNNRVSDVVLLNIEGLTQGTRQAAFYSKLKSVTYDLDIEKEKSGGLFSKVQDEEKEKYDFKNFFVRNFFPAIEEGKEYIDDEEVKIGNQDSVVSVYKKAVLLGKKGEFTPLRGFLDIEYDDLTVERTDQSSSISFSKSILNATGGNEGKSVFAEVSGNYTLSDTDHYFSNLFFTFYSNGSRGNERKYLFGGVPVKVTGKVELTDFREDIKVFLSNFEKISQKYTSGVSEIVYNSKIKKVFVK